MNRAVVLMSRQRDRGLRRVVRSRAVLVVLVVLVAMQGGSASAVAQGSEAASSSDVILNGHHLSIARAVAVARHDAAVVIPAQVMRRVQRSFVLLFEAAREDKPIYGLTRGVGENKDKTIFKGGRIDAAAQRLSEQFNANLLRVQATAFGAPASVEIVRAAMVIRLNQMLIGHTGVQQSVVEGLEHFLNRGITPVVPSKGTVGEADIDILAHIGLALMGEGDVQYHGATIPAAAALSQAGLTPIVPFAKDALSIFSSNAFSAGIAVLAEHDAHHLLGRARRVFGLSLEGLNGNIAPFLAPVQSVRAFPGQARVAAAIRRDLAGSYVRSLSHKRALQDPLSYRTFSQVLGSAQDVLSRLRRQLGVQMNTSDDNPTVVLDIVPPRHATPQQRAYYVNGHGIHGAVLPTANFDPLSWVLQLESLSVALGHMSSTSVQRILRLGMPEFTHLSRFLTANRASIGFAAIQKIPADLDARNEQLANPVSLDVTPVAGDIEDTATNAAAAATNAQHIVDNLRGILGVELMHAAQAVSLRQLKNQHLALGRATRPFLNAYRHVVSFLDKDRYLSPDVQNSAAFLRTSAG
jgi:histidine ammonia-lyase